MSVIARIGLFELAFGALLGWALVLQLTNPGLLSKLGVVSPRRILQAHLDFILMGLILVAVGLAVPGLPTWIAVTLVIGTLLNPALFLPMAFSEGIVRSRPYQAVSALSFIATTGGLVAAAAVA